jgi:hypothetical protein
MPKEERTMAEPKKKGGGFWGLFRAQSSANKARKLVCAPLFLASDCIGD